MADSHTPSNHLKDMPVLKDHKLKLTVHKKDIIRQLHKNNGHAYAAQQQLVNDSITMRPITRTFLSSPREIRNMIYREYRNSVPILHLFHEPDVKLPYDRSNDLILVAPHLASSSRSVV